MYHSVLFFWHLSFLFLALLLAFNTSSYSSSGSISISFSFQHFFYARGNMTACTVLVFSINWGHHGAAQNILGQCWHASNLYLTFVWFPQYALRAHLTQMLISGRQEELNCLWVAWWRGRWAEGLFWEWGHAHWADRKPDCLCKEQHHQR